MRTSVLALLAVLAVLAAGCASPSISPDLTNDPNAPTAVDAPIGSWSMTVTAADLAEAGHTDPGFARENTGTFTYTFGADGSWSVAQASSNPVRWPVFRGTYVVTGPSALQMTTDFPSDYAGDIVDVTWSRDADGLRFRLVSPNDPILRLNLEQHPWTPLP